MRSSGVMLAGVLQLFLTVSTFGQGDLLPAPQLFSVFPLGAQVGSTIEVTVSGEHLDAATELVFSHRDIRGKPKLDRSGRAVRNVFVVEVDPSTPPAAYDVRLRGKFGMSNARRFIVGTRVELTPDKIGSQREQATEIGVDQVINATVSSSAQSWFRTSVTSRVKLALRLDAPDTRLEPSVTITDSQGRIVARGRGLPIRLEFVPPQAGEYFIGVNDLLFRGGDEFRYRLCVSTSSSEIEPPTVVPLVAGGLANDERQRIIAKANANTGVRPHDKVLRVPDEYSSVFPKAGQAASFVFDAEAQREVWIEVWSHRLGYPTDVALTVQRMERAADGSEKAEFVAEAADIQYSASAIGFGLESLDGILRFVPPSKGTYRLSLRDLFNTGPTSPRYPYCLRIRQAKPDFYLIAVPDQGPRARPVPSSVLVAPPTLRRGGVASVRVFAQRQDGFEGDIHVTATGLPDGVTCLGAVLGKGDECAALTFYAAEDAPVWSGFVEIQGQAVIAGEQIKRTASTGSAIWSVKDTRQDSFRSRTTDGMGLAVIAEDAPVLLEPEVSDIIEAKATDKIVVKLRVVRRNGYDAIIALRPFVLGDQDKSARSDHSIPAGAQEVSIELDLAKLSVQPGEHTFVFHGNADKVSYRKNLEWVAPAEEEMKRVIKELGDSQAALQQKKQAVADLTRGLKEAQGKLKDASAETKAALGAMVQAAQERLSEAESALKVADSDVQMLTQAKTEAEKNFKDLQKAAEPKDMSYAVFSKPIRIRIVPSAEKR